jgi:biopolymer transport protein ExbB
MEGVDGFWVQSDGIIRAVAALLMLMSIGAWVLILWKGWVLRRATRDIARGVATFWEAPSLTSARERMAPTDRESLLLPLLDAAFAQPAAGTLEGQGAAEAQLTRRLRDALHHALNHLQFGQVFLASVGATAPFIGLFGTVWGIYHALLGMASSGAMTVEKIAGPVGEALVMTAAGLAVAIPAVLAYNVFGKWLGACEAELEGFAHDLRETALGHPTNND